MERMVDRISTEGSTAPGFAPALTSLLGPNTFSVIPHAPRFAGLIAAGCPTGRSIYNAWTNMRHAIRDLSGAFAVEADNAGQGLERVQAALTRTRERQDFQDLDVLARALPTGDARRTAWLNIDAFSAAWATAWPCSVSWTCDAEFVEISTRYLGSPAQRARHGLGNVYWERC